MPETPLSLPGYLPKEKEPLQRYHIGVGVAANPFGPLSPFQPIPSLRCWICLKRAGDSTVCGLPLHHYSKRLTILDGSPRILPDEWRILAPSTVFRLGRPNSITYEKTEA